HRLTLTIEADKILKSRLLEESTFSLPSSPANAIDIHTRTDEGQTVVIQGLVSLDGDFLRLSFAFDLERPRPSSFATKAGDPHSVYFFERLKPGEAPPETAGAKLGAVLE